MNIYNSYKRSRFFLWVNIISLAIGLAASIMLILFVVNEWSYDRHFANHERIVRLLTVYNNEGQTVYMPVNLRTAYNELPQSVPGIEAACQLNDWGNNGELVYRNRRFQNVKFLLADPEIFRIFQMKFVEGNPETSLAAPNTAVITRSYANIIFGSPEAAMNQSVSYGETVYVITGVVEDLPMNTHFNFDIMASMQSNPFLTSQKSLEFYTYYLIKKEASVEEVRATIENVYNPLLTQWKERNNYPDAHGITEMLSDIYLKSNATNSIGAVGSLPLIRILTALAFFILILAVTNFINLYVTQGEMRMQEIGIRKTNGAQIGDIVRQFFSEVSVIVLLAFGLGFFIAIFCVHYFSGLINKNIDLKQLATLPSIISMLFLFVVTVVLSALYPAVYLSRFSPLEILGKRIRLSKRRLTAAIVIFQSVISIVLLSVIITLFKQVSYLEKLPLGLNPDNVMTVIGSRELDKNNQAVKQELLKLPEVKAVCGSDHIFGGRCSGQSIALLEEKDNEKRINEYRMTKGMPEFVELKLVEGRFWQEDDPDSIQMIILNEAAVKMLGGKSLLEKQISYRGEPAIVTGVVKDFFYDNPALSIAPVVLTNRVYSRVINIRFNENVSRVRAQQITLDVLRRFDSEFVLNPLWCTDIYQSKFKEIKTLTQIILTGSIISIFIAMLGILAIHLFSAVRRTKEIGIRRIHGAEKSSVFLLLSLDVLKWIAIAAVIAIPIAVYFVSGMLGNYANHIDVSWTMFVLPILIQCLIALLTTSGISISVLSQNPVKSLKSE